MSNETEHITFDAETKTKIGAVTYIVAAHFDETKENLPKKIRRLLRSEVESKITHLRSSSQ